VVAVPFDDIVRVEIFAVHPSEKPENLPLITGFRSSPDGPVLREDPAEAKPPVTFAGRRRPCSPGVSPG